MTARTSTIVVLGRVGSWHWQDLQRAAGPARILVPQRFEDLQVSLSSDAVHVQTSSLRLDTANGILVRAMPRGTLEEIVFRMDALAALAAAGVTVLNAPRSIELCIDKFAVLERLRREGLPVPRTWVGQQAEGAFAAWEQLGQDVVLKPIFGSEGRGLVRLRTADLARRLFRVLADQGQVIYLQEYLHHPQWDLRLLVLGDDLFAIQRCSPTDWRLNASRGARVQPWQPTAVEQDLARRAAQAAGAEFCGVDLLYDASGSPWIIELNASPGWKYLSQACQIDIADRVLNRLDGADRITRR